jgi:hypothetical protein
MASHQIDGPTIAGLIVASLCVTGLIVGEIRHRVAKARPCSHCKGGTVTDCVRCAFSSHIPLNQKPTHSRHREPLRDFNGIHT